MKRMVIECENGDRYDQVVDDGQRLKITKGGKVFLIVPGEKPIGTSDLGSRAVALYELVPVDPDEQRVLVNTGQIG